MGNSDLVFVFNKYALLIKGADYSNRYEAIDKALEKYKAVASEAIKQWYETQERHPDMVNPFFNVEDEWEIKEIKIFSL